MWRYPVGSPGGARAEVPPISVKVAATSACRLTTFLMARFDRHRLVIMTEAAVPTARHLWRAPRGSMHEGACPRRSACKERSIRNSGGAHAHPLQLDSVTMNMNRHHGCVIPMCLLRLVFYPFTAEFPTMPWTMAPRLHRSPASVAAMVSRAGDRNFLPCSRRSSLRLLTTYTISRSSCR